MLCRYGVDQWLARPGESFPLSTFLINIVGAALAGFLFAWSEGRGLAPEWQAGLLVGFCGGFTTFSAYALQAVTLMDRGHALLAAFYLVSSPVVGFGAAALSLFFSRRFLF